MEAEILTSITQSNCRHKTHRRYEERSFDMLYGFEVLTVRCCNCHKILELRITKMRA